MGKQNRMPAIRFRGFVDPWEQRKLGDITVKIGSGKTPSGGKNAYVETGIPLIRSQNVNGDRVDFEDVVYIDEATDESMANSRVFTNDVLLNITGASIGRSTVYKGFEQANVNQHVCIIRPIEGFNPDFIQLNLTSDNGQKQIESSQAGGGREGLNFQQIGKMEFSFPQIDEQRKIGTYFNFIDRLITLHQRKYDKLVAIKKSMLEKMFPREGSRFPEIRFAGFAEPWERRKLSEIANKVTEKNDGLKCVETFTNSAEFGIISQRDFFDHDIAKLGSLGGYYIVKKEDFVYNPRISTSAPVGPINRNKLGRTGVMSPLYTVFRPHDIDTTYLEYFFKCGYWHSFMNFNGDSGARSDRFSIKDNVFFQMPIPIPPIEEQKKIGEYLTGLDNLITLQQRKLEKLQAIKKSMLEKMFA